MIIKSQIVLRKKLSLLNISQHEVLKDINVKNYS